ncbi:zonadhesin-like [Mytilus californianus]|uniref:zonadhesin-like n=1 Tax=Mytilus californianus TaxID=6549 RepID=UPI002245A38C|nr:zonadhesin-like [Mytilus californianus]
MGQVTVVLVASLIAVFVNFTEGVCTGYYYSTCSKYVYNQERYTTPCGWWGRCTKYKQEKKIEYYRCQKKCPTVHGRWSSYGNWERWGSCSKTCGGGTQSTRRLRYCNNPSPKNGGNGCSGSNRSTKSRSCNTNYCPINGQWTKWKSWSKYGPCSASCGSGKQSRTRTRTCSKPSPKYGGKTCPGESMMTSSQTCNTNPCPVDGKWGSFSKWSEWGSCSVTCGQGLKTRSRSRSCDNPEPKYDGMSCIGKPVTVDSQQCMEIQCPVDGGWTDFLSWSTWTTCSETCGFGVEKSFRTRLCENPEAEYGGKPCPGDNTEERTQQCKIKECPGYCECSTVGDTHYRTFDGQWIDFMGSCHYLLVKTAPDDIDCRFSVVVINKAASQTSQLPYTRIIELAIEDFKIRLLPDKVVLVDGTKVSLPYNTKDNSVNIFVSGRYVRVQTNCDVILEWDGSKNLELAALDTFAKRMTGICGNCDGIRNEFSAANYSNPSDEPTKMGMIVETFALAEEAKEAGDTCGVLSEIPATTSAVEVIASAPEYCGHLILKENGTSPFQKCLESSSIQADKYYSMCVSDVSLYYNTNNNDLEKAVCDNLESFALHCAEEAIAVNWRSDEFCPLSCGINEVYSDRVSGCQANCVNRDSDKTCELPFTEGCACEEGYILSGKECVKAEDCGCSSDVGYIALGDEVLSADCTKNYKCIRINGTGNLIEEAANKCHENAICQPNAEGDLLCRCKLQYEGDGIVECKPKEKDCTLTKSGTNYKGKTSITESGISCQAWAEKTPHKHKYAVKLSDQSNYCRNPDGSNRPWCYTINKEKRWEYCHIPRCDIKECKSDKKGTDYEGHKSITTSGIECQTWAASEPHKHRYSKKLAKDKNYCRNPDGSKEPWCYTSDPNKRWEYCDIPLCEVKQCKEDAKGSDYNGHQNTTSSGNICQAWGSQEPHRHSLSRLAAEMNYCRNPDGSSKPWCYTLEKEKRWDYCDIPLC